MDHGGHGGGGESTGEIICKMSMALHGGACEMVLWKGWMANTMTKFLFSLLACFVIAFFFEGLKYYREILFSRNAPQQPCKEGASTESGMQLSPPVTSRWYDYMMDKDHIIQTALHFVQVFTGYILMLIAMTFNIWICLVIFIGAACGYFLFGWSRKRNYDLTECCH